ncbi:MAG: alpha/beta fold hydrolase [Anaerovoracaceae bacterium]
MLKNKKRIVITLCTTLLILFVIAPLSLSVYIYSSNFGSRYESLSWMERSLSEFPGLMADRYTFSSNKEQQLVGYSYYRDTENIKGVVVIAHGLGGGGHNSYMDVANHFASNEYVVFAYDATGNSESEGDSVRGIPQGLIDLDYALRFVKSNSEFNNLPIMLFGHSWGAYSAGSVLNVHPDIKAVAMVAGFNQSLDIIEEEGQRIAGNQMSLLMPYISMIERMKFGTNASYTCMDGFEASNAGVMIIHSADDEMVSFENHFQRFYNTYQNNSRFTFIKYEDRGHDYIFYSDLSKVYRNEINNQFEEYVNSLNTELTAEIKTEYMDAHLDKTQLFDLNIELMDQVVSFYDKYAI